MSHAIKFSGPFVKQMYSGFYTGGRTDANPLSGIAYSATVPTPHRRIYTVIQNQGTTDVVLNFETDGSALLQNAGLKLFAGQSISLDNYNGPIHILLGDGDDITITESFA